MHKHYKNKGQGKEIASENCKKTDIVLLLFVCVAHNGRVHTHMRCIFCIKNTPKKHMKGSVRNSFLFPKRVRLRTLILIWRIWNSICYKEGEDSDHILTETCMVRIGMLYRFCCAQQLRTSIMWIKPNDFMSFGFLCA